MEVFAILFVCSVFSLLGTSRSDLPILFSHLPSDMLMNTRRLRSTLTPWFRGSRRWAHSSCVDTERV